MANQKTNTDRQNPVLKALVSKKKRLNALPTKESGPVKRAKHKGTNSRVRKADNEA